MRRIKLAELGAIHWLPCTFVDNGFDQVLQVLDPCDAFRVHVSIIGLGDDLMHARGVLHPTAVWKHNPDQIEDAGAGSCGESDAKVLVLVWRTSRHCTLPHDSEW